MHLRFGEAGKRGALRQRKRDTPAISQLPPPTPPPVEYAVLLSRAGSRDKNDLTAAHLEYARACALAPTCACPREAEHLGVCVPIWFGARTGGLMGFGRRRSSGHNEIVTSGVELCSCGVVHLNEWRMLLL